MLIVLFSICSAHCTVLNLQCSLYCSQSAVLIVQFSICSAHCTVLNLQCSLWSSQCLGPNLQYCVGPNLQCSLSRAQFAELQLQCSLCSDQCAIMSDCRTFRFPLSAWASGWARGRARAAGGRSWSGDTTSPPGSWPTAWVSPSHR